MREAAGIVGHLNGDDIGHSRNVARRIKYGFTGSRVADDQAQDAELGGIGERQSVNIDALSGKRVTGGVQATGAVFDKAGNLGYFHFIVSLRWRLKSPASWLSAVQ